MRHDHPPRPKAREAAIDERSMGARIRSLANEWTPARRYTGQLFVVQDIVRAAYPKADAQVICSDQFMERTSGADDPEWVARELIQNCIDHNPASPQTLNGVTVTQEKLDDGYVRFTIRGEWSIPDTSGLVSPHSEGKSEHSAGGNGIGLKQTALLLEKKFGSRRFDIQTTDGVDRADVRYFTTNKEDLATVREAAQQRSEQPIPEVRNNWLVAIADEQKLARPESPHFTYTIETKDAATIRALAEITDLGVHDKNPFLQNPDYVSSKGQIKWLPLDSTTEDSRFFLNGQVMNVDVGRNKDGDYWQGLQGATVEVHDVKYAITIMRPPLSSYDVQSKLREVVQEMTIADAIDQLKRSAYLWQAFPDDSAYSYSKPRVGGMMVVESIVERIRSRSWGSEKYTYDQFVQDFGSAMFRSVDRDLRDEELAELKAKGFILCPKYFKDLGVPVATGELDAVKKRALEMPDTAKAKEQIDRMVGETGVEAGYTAIEGRLRPEQFVQELAKVISALGLKMQIDENGVMQLQCTDVLPIDQAIRLNAKSLVSARTAQEKQIAQLRGLVVAGRAFGYGNGSMMVTHEKTSVSLATDEKEPDRLFVRKKENQDALPSEMRIQLNADIAALIKKMQQQVRAAEQGAAQEGEATELVARTTVTQEKKREREKSVLSPILTRALQTVLVAALGTGAFALGGKAMRGEDFDMEAMGKNLMGMMAGEEGDAREAGGTTVEGVQQGPLVVEEIDPRQAAIDDIKKRMAALGLGGEKDPTMSIFQRAKKEGGSWLKRFMDAASGYASGDQLDSIVTKYKPANIEGVESSPEQRLVSQLESAIPHVDGHVQDFAVVEKPTDAQLTQLAMLRTFVEVSTGYGVQNDLFLFTGKGASGMNMGDEGAIGMHAEMLEEDFTAALSTFIHEAAHNRGDQHDSEWQHTNSALWAAVYDNLDSISERLLSGDIQPGDKELIQFEEQWEQLRTFDERQ